MESVLAAARVVLASGSMVAIYIDPTEPSRYASMAYALLGLYFAEAVIVLWYVRHGRSATKNVPPLFSGIVYGVDLL